MSSRQSAGSSIKDAESASKKSITQHSRLPIIAGALLVAAVASALFCILGPRPGSFSSLLGLKGAVEVEEIEPELSLPIGYNEYLQGRLEVADPRHATFSLALRLMRVRNVRTILETGVNKSDGGSTLIFSRWARDHNAEVYSVDPSQKDLEITRKVVAAAVPRYAASLHYELSDPPAFIHEFGKTIDFLYLNSATYDASSPETSQKQMLVEIDAAYPYLKHDTLVMLDDCGLPWGGKCALVIEYLQVRGWKVLTHRYQAILSR